MRVPCRISGRCSGVLGWRRLTAAFSSGTDEPAPAAAGGNREAGRRRGAPQSQPLQDPPSRNPDDDGPCYGSPPEEGFHGIGAPKYGHVHRHPERYTDSDDEGGDGEETSSVREVLPPPQERQQGRPKALQRNMASPAAHRPRSGSWEEPGPEADESPGQDVPGLPMRR